MENKPLFTEEQLEGTPFQIIHTEEDNKYFIIWSNLRLSPSFNYKQEAVNYIEENRWTTIMLLMVHLMNRHEEIMEKMKTVKEEELV